MKILIYGAGAVGGYLGARLVLAGNDVTLIARDFTAKTISASGLSLTENGQTVLTRPKAAASMAHAFMEEEVSYDLIIMSMKAYDLAPALDPLIAFCPEPPLIIAVQNGIDVERPLIAQFGTERVIAGSLTTPIRKETLSSLTVARSGRGLGLSPTQPRQNIDQWVGLFQKAGINTVRVADYHSMRWSKALLNIVGNATSAILNRTPEIIYKSSNMYDVELRMLRETLAVMEKLKLKIVNLPGAPTSRLVTGVRRMPQPLLKPILTNIVAKGRGDKMPSFHIDLSTGKGKCEVEYHNGAIARIGREQGVRTPVNWFLNDLLMKLAREEVNWRAYDGRPKRLLMDLKRYEQAAKGKA
jgi:2-dehydropantoate 2-reductase